MAGALARSQLKPQLTHEGMLGGDLFQHRQACDVVLELGVSGAVVRVKDVLAAGRAAA